MGIDALKTLLGELIKCTCIVLYCIVLYCIAYEFLYHGFDLLDFRTTRARSLSARCLCKVGNKTLPR